TRIVPRRSPLRASLRSSRSLAFPMSSSVAVSPSCAGTGNSGSSRPSCSPSRSRCSVSGAMLIVAESGVRV
ncbi:hypothetical protein EXIGLDRAFT_727688, partial [Exidia glandulosa HHB12029]